MTPEPYLEIAVAAPIHHTLTYSPPAGCQTELEPGMRLLVPLAGRQVTGYLLGFHERPPEGRKTRAAVELLDEDPVFPAEIIPFYRWIARYYQYPIGEVVRTALPGGMAPRSGRRVIVTETGRQPLTRLLEKQKHTPAWLAALLEKGELTPAAVRKLWRGKTRRLLEQWASSRWLIVRREITGATSRRKTETCIFPVSPSVCDEPDGGAEPELKPSEKKTLGIYRRLAQEIGKPEIPRRELTREYAGAGRALAGLVEKKIIGLTERHVYRNPFGELPVSRGKSHHLTGQQQAAVDELLPAIRRREYGAYLLQGVTGSGKTEIYLRAAEAALARGRGVLILVPEIALAAQLEGDFLSHFGDRVALLHSGLSSGERFDQWQRIRKGEADVVIGARSAVFAPLLDPGLIVVDEEHESAYKQEEGLRYQGRDLAVLRASRNRAVVLLGSATPSVISRYHAMTGKYRLLTLESRIADRELPRMEIVDLRRVRKTAGRQPLFSDRLITALRDNLAGGEQSLIFLNRRGFANLMLCTQCGRTLQCRHCHITLTHHRQRHVLLCHYCGYSVRENTVCPDCRSTELLGIGFGTERLEAELHSLFPDARIGRLDRDTCRNRRDFLALLKSMRDRRLDILVGTQMIAKGHHFPGVTLVGVVWADAGLGMPDFRAGERTFQLITQVSGRAGRGEKSGLVIVQTHQPDHYSIELARSYDYEGMFQRELEQRRQLGYPPFARLINLQLEGDSEDAVRTAAEEMARRVRRRKKQDPRILGPAPAPLSRLRGRYRWHLLLKGSSLEELHNTAAGLIRIAAGIHGGGLKVVLDIDPENML